MVVASTTRFENALDERIDRATFFALIVPGRTVLKARWEGSSDAGTAPREIEIEH